MYMFVTVTVISGETPSRESSLMRKALDKEDIMRSKNKKCKCDKNCMGMFSAKDIYNLRERYWTNTRRAQFQILIHTMGQQYKKGSFFYLPLDNGKTVCVKAFKLILKVNKNALTEAKKSHQRGAKSTAGKSPKSVSHRTEQTISWFEMYAEFHGDRMPHSRDVLLPYKTTKVGVFQSYRTQVEEASRVSATLFYKIWKERFPHVKIKEVSNLFFIMHMCKNIITLLYVMYFAYRWNTVSDSFHFTFGTKTNRPSCPWLHM